jgi:hypothetical protein
MSRVSDLLGLAHEKTEFERKMGGRGPGPFRSKLFLDCGANEVEAKNDN